MKKKLFLSLMVITLGLLIFGALSVSAETSGTFTYDVVEGEAMITGVADYQSLPEALEIPAQIETYPVTAIDEWALSYTSIKSVTIPASVKSIEPTSFTSCYVLENISVDSNNQYFSSSDGVLFDKNMTELLCLPEGKQDTSYVVPDSVTTLGSYAFGSNGSLTSITLGKGAKDVDASCFIDCIYLASILVDADNQWYTSQDDILMSKDKTEVVHYPSRKEGTTYTTPAGVTKIGNYAFEGCYLESISLGEGVTSIGDSAFAGSKIERITLPEGLESIGVKAFYFCSELTSEGITLPNSLTIIGQSAFSGCFDLTTITIPEKITTIAQSTFSSCEGLTEMVIPDTVKEIEPMAFYNCSGLKKVTIGEGVTRIGIEAFAGCTALLNVVGGNHVTSIEEGAFKDCTELRSFTIPDSVTDISYNYNIFSNCTKLQEVVLGKGMTSVSGYMFSGCTSLTKVTIPDSVKQVINGAFQGCTALESIDLGEGVTYIASAAFQGCTGLKSITIPKGVTVISDTVFQGCESLTTVNFNGTEEEWNNIWISEDNDPVVNATKNYFWYVKYMDENGTLLQKDMVSHNTATSPSTNLGDASAGIFFADEGFTTAFDFTTPITKDTIVYVKGSGATTPAPYTINSITIKDGAGTVLAAIPANNFLATVSITNKNADGDNVVVLAQYSTKGVLTGLMYVGVEDMPVGATFKLTIPVDNTAGNVANLKAFVWDSFGSATTLGNTLTFPAE